MFDSAAGLGKVFRSEIIPMLKSNGFNLKVATTRKSYYHDGKINVVVDRVPSNFPVWKSEYSRWDRTENANRLTQTIKDRLLTLVSENNSLLEKDDKYALDIDIEVSYGKNIKFIHYEGMDESD